MAITQIEAALPGLIFHRPSPEAEPFKATGDAVAVGDTLALVGVMRSYFSLEAEVAGTFQAYWVCDGESLEPGDGLGENAGAD